MDLLKIGLRNLLGIIAPGAMMFISFILAFLILIYPYSNWIHNLTFIQYSGNCLKIIKSIPTSITFLVFILISYVIGSLFRLTSADDVDTRTENYNLEDLIMNITNKDRTLTDEILEEISDKKKAWKTKNQNGTLTESLIDLLLNKNLTLSEYDKHKLKWTTDFFPFTDWEFIKLDYYHPKPIKRFFSFYKREMQTGRTSGKEFINFCKSVVKYSRKTVGDPLIEEMDLMEATVRFYAGIYTMLNWTFILTAFVFTTSFIHPIFRFVAFVFHQKPIEIVSAFKYTGGVFISMFEYYSIVFIFSLILSYFIWKSISMIRMRFRYIRLKEVDTVYDAFYLAIRGTSELEKYEGN